VCYDRPRDDVRATERDPRFMSSPWPRLDREDGIATVALAVYVVVVLWPVASLRRALYYFDITEYAVPFRHFYARALREGELPLWTDGVFGGYPIFAEAQSGALYPPYLIFYPWMQAWAAHNLTYVLLSITTALGVYAWMRFHVRAASAAMAGAIFVFSGAWLTHHFHMSMIAAVATWPWMLACVESLRRSPRGLGRMLALSLLAATLCFAGHAQSVVLGAFALGVVTLASWRREDGARALAVHGGSVALAFGMGVVLAAVQWLPTLELTARSMRSDALDVWTRSVSSWPPWMLLQWSLPHSWGTLANDTALEDEVEHFHEVAQWLGVCAPLLVPMAWRSDARRGLRALWVLGAISLLMALGR